MKAATKIYLALGRILYALLYPVFIIHPSTRTRGLLIDQNNKVLLVKNWVSNGAWDMPGGGLHSHESPAQCIARELNEETGITVDITAWRLVATHRIHATDFVYLEALTQSTELKLQLLEITDAAWFSKDELPKNRNPLVDTILTASSLLNA